jgi:hypothetical protein
MLWVCLPGLLTLDAGSESGGSVGHAGVLPAGADSGKIRPIERHKVNTGCDRQEGVVNVRGMATSLSMYTLIQAAFKLHSSCIQAAFKQCCATTAGIASGSERRICHSVQY